MMPSNSSPLSHGAASCQLSPMRTASGSSPFTALRNLRQKSCETSSATSSRQPSMPVSLIQWSATPMRKFCTSSLLVFHLGI